MRFDWFLRMRKGRPAGLRRWLRRLGPTWASSPLRRVVQGAALGAFLVLLFYVAWPYSARPARQWTGWLPLEVNAASGEVTLQNDHPPADAPGAGKVVWLASGPTPFGEFSITTVSGGSITLRPAQALPESIVEQMGFALGSWTVHERDPDAPASHYAEDLARKERVQAEAFLALDPLVSLSTAVAARAWVWSLAWAGVILAICLLIPRGFCGYLCPLGTTIDLFDWLVGRRVKWLRVAGNGWWVHLKYYLLAGTLVAAVLGVLVSGFLSAIPIVTRGALFIVKPLHDGVERGWHNVPPVTLGHVAGVAVFIAVLMLGLLSPRFWCRYVCPTGAIFSLGNLLRATQRKVESSCIHCNKCVEICPFDAIKPDFNTRTTDCTFCQTCGGVCPTHAIKFVPRWNRVSLKVINDPPTGETAIGRRGFLSAGVGMAAALAGGGAAAGILRDGTARRVRPPGSVIESEFLQLCIRCGECFRACPNDVLWPLGLQQGLSGLWTPYVNADWAGCEPSCNNCGQVCPTGAIRALPLEVKRSTRMGLAVVDAATCLPWAGKEACQLCVDECAAAGYNAIEFMRTGTQADADGTAIPGTGLLAPVVKADLCIGCGLCQTRCYAINVQEKRLLARSAIVVKA